MRLLATVLAATVLGCGSGFAQVSGTGWSPLGMTSPLGMSPGGVGPTGIPMGATELATPGLSPGPVSGAISAFTNATCPTMTPGPSSSTGLFISGGVGTDATPLGPSSPNSMSSGTCTQTIGTSTTTSATTPPLSTGSTPGIPTIPLGSTGLGNAGLSPAPCPSTGYSSSATSGMISGSC
jgi:hypothetical protein